MFGRILRLLLRTRFTAYYFMGLLFVFIYSTFAQFSQQSVERHLVGLLYVSFVLTIFGAISIMLGGLMSSKSDSEFLFVSAVKRRDLGSALFLSQFLTTGPLILAGSLYYVFSMGNTTAIEIVHFFDLLFMALLVVSLGIVLSVLKTLQRAILTAVYVLWILSSIIGFPLGGTSFLGEHLWPSTLMITAATLVSVVGAVVALSGEHLPVRISALKSGSRDFKKITRFSDLSPFRTVLRFGITQISIASRSASMGSMRVSARRIRLIYFIVAMCVAAVTYVVVSLKFPEVTEGNFNTVIFLFSFYFGIFPQVMISSGAIAMERAWLSFMSMEPWRYMRYLLISKMAQALVISTPMSLASIVLWFLGVPTGIPAAISFALFPPAIVSLYLFISFSVRPYQMREEEFIATRFGGTQYMIIVPIFVYSFAIVFALVIPFTIPYITALLYLVTIYILTRHRYWNERLTKAVESGFV